MMSTKKLLIAKFNLDLKKSGERIMKNSVENIIQEIINIITESTGNISSIDWKKWHIGLTIYPNQEKRVQGKITDWNYWKANSADDAVKIQNYFLDNYPINHNRVNDLYDYFVYIFKQ